MAELEDKVGQFVSVTNCSEEVARRYLAACAGDLDMAVGMHLESKVSSPPATAEALTSGASTSQYKDEPLSPTSYKRM